MLKETLSSKGNKLKIVFIIFAILLVIAISIDSIISLRIGNGLSRTNNNKAYNNSPTTTANYGKDTYVTKKEDIPDEIMTKMLTYTNDTISSWVARSGEYMLYSWDWFPKGFEVPKNASVSTDVKPYKLYIGSEKGTEGNVVMFVYKAKITGVKEYECFYFPVWYEDVVLNSEKECKIDLSQPERSLGGNADFDVLYTKVIVANKDKYTFETYDIGGDN